MHNKSHTKKSKIKISNSKKVKRCSIKTEFKKGKPSWNKGKNIQTNSGKTHFKKGCTPWNKGKHTGIKPWLNKKRPELSGEKNNRWKGGISNLYSQIRSSFEYRLWIRYCMERDNFTCQKCKILCGDLEVHHLKAFAKIIKENNIKSLDDARKCEELWNLENGYTLCFDCHCELDPNRRKKCH